MRKTVYNNLTDWKKWKAVSKKNKELITDFINYCQAEDKSMETLKQYTHNLKIFFCWIVENADNKFFVDLKIKDIMRYQQFLISLRLSGARIRSLKAVLSSLSKYIELVEIDTYPDFRNIINKIKAPNLIEVRDKTILNEQDVKDMLQILVDKKLYQQSCFLALAAFSGSRKAELLKFKVDFFNDKNYIKQLGMWKTPKIRTKGKGKVGKPLSKYVIRKYFEPYLKLWLDERKNLGIDSEWLFVVRTKPATISTANYWSKVITNITGKSIYWHCFRHFLTTMLSKNKVPNNIIKGLFGWESLNMVDIYDDTEIEDSFVDFFSEDGIKVKNNSNAGITI